jgi:hypothetical protein
MMRQILVLSGLLAIFLLAACARYTAVKPVETREIGGVLRVSPQITWSSFKEGDRETWTINGVGLESLTFVTALEPGESLLPGERGKDAPTYREKMRAPDVVDLFEATLITLQYSQIDARNLRPLEIPGARAFRFEFSAFDSHGLAKQGIVVGLIDEEDGLSLVLYEGAAEHYYGEHLDEAEAVLGSIEKI